MYQRILVPIDGSPTSDLGLDEAIRLAKLTGGSLRLIHVIDDLSIIRGMEGYAAYSEVMFADLRAAGAQVIETARAKVAAAGVNVETILHETMEGLVPELVIADARAWKADLIVLGTHGRRGIRRMVLGSSAEYVLRGAPVPVLLVRVPEAATAA